MKPSLNDLIQMCQTRTDKIFSHYLSEKTSSAESLKKAMAYSVLNGGKRIRPLLVYATGHALDASFDVLDISACAVEFIHAYSLIHDDLPAMDNADLRRGKPSCHKAFNEALAILAGDALQALAFEVIASHPAALSIEKRLDMINILSRACGPCGMAAGQTLDIEGTQTLNELTQMYQLKTGALITASVKLGMLSAHIDKTKTQDSLEKFAECIGLAFQIQDDLLDVESSTENTGKPKGLDALNQKNTYPALLGVEKTRERIQELFESALQSIQFLGEKGKPLHELAHYLLQRKA